MINRLNDGTELKRQYELERSVSFQLNKEVHFVNGRTEQKTRRNRQESTTANVSDFCTS